MVTAHDLTFGVEIETYLPRQSIPDGLVVGPRHRGLQIPYLPLGWKAEHDGSISAPNGMACEVVSPVLSGSFGLEATISACKTLLQKGHATNATCGVHVHIGWSRSLPSDALARLITAVAHLETGLYAITGTKARERGTYCGGVRKYQDHKRAKENLDRDRYHALNLTNLASARQQTVEFRVFSGSLNPVKIAGWIQVCLGIVQRAINGRRSAKWHPTPPTGGWKKAGPGQSECERLIGYLAWGEGYAKIHNGVHFGWLSTSITEEQVKDEFRRLAKKYDAQP